MAILVGLLVLLLLGVVAIVVARAAKRTPLGRAVGASVALLIAAAMLYGTSLLLAHGARCPGRGYEPSGLEKPISIWPPGAECHPGAGPGGDRDLVVVEPAPWLKWATAWLALGAPLVLLTGFAADLRDRRGRSQPERRSGLIPT
jgi:hypothetical protein